MHLDILCVPNKLETMGNKSDELLLKKRHFLVRTLRRQHKAKTDDLTYFKVKCRHICHKVIQMTHYLFSSEVYKLVFCVAFPCRQTSVIYHTGQLAAGSG